MYWITAFLGVVSIAAPFILGYSDTPMSMWTSLVIGFALTGASLFEWAAEGEQRWEYWVLGLAGVAAVIAPFILGLGLMSMSSWTMLVTGFIALGIAGIKLFQGKAQY